ncbi:unnamed protein product [Sphagnum balticum]
MTEHWVDPRYQRKESIFKQRTAEIQKQISFNKNERESLIYAAVASTNAPQVDSGNEISDDEIDRLAFLDDETGAFNFRYFIRSFYREVKRSARYRRFLSLMLVKIDGLMEIGRAYGVLTLENCVFATAETLITSCRADLDMVGRYSEGSFLILLPETTPEEALITAKRLQSKFQLLTVAHQFHEIKVTVNIGIANFPEQGDDIESLIAFSELCCDDAAENGGERISSDPYHVSDRNRYDYRSD